jgi:cytochrome c biogenesis protein CcmG, thiol:disulfide interchange protein DsbE
MNIDHPWFPHVAAGITAAVLVAGAAWIVQVPAPVEEGTEAPAFAGVDLDGSAVSLEDFDDKVILLNIWATWCAPCRREMPSMQRLYDDVSDESFEIVAVSIDGAADQSEVLRRIGEFGEELGLGFTLLHDAKHVTRRRYQSRGVPESFLIGRDRVIRLRAMGEKEWDAPEYRDLVVALLKDESEALGSR